MKYIFYGMGCYSIVQGIEQTNIIKSKVLIILGIVWLIMGFVMHLINKEAGE